MAGRQPRTETEALWVIVCLVLVVAVLASLLTDGEGSDVMLVWRPDAGSEPQMRELPEAGWSRTPR